MIICKVLFKIILVFKLLVINLINVYVINGWWNWNLFKIFFILVRKVMSKIKIIDIIDMISFLFWFVFGELCVC